MSRLHTQIHACIYHFMSECIKSMSVTNTYNGLQTMTN